MAKPRRHPLGNRNIVGAKITHLRKSKHIKQCELAAELQRLGMDIGESSLSRLEGQQRLVQDFEIPILARALGVSIQWLLEEEEEPPPCGRM